MLPKVSDKQRNTDGWAGVKVSWCFHSRQGNSRHAGKPLLTLMLTNIYKKKKEKKRRGGCIKDCLLKRLRKKFSFDRLFIYLRFSTNSVISSKTKTNSLKSSFQGLSWGICDLHLNLRSHPPPLTKHCHTREKVSSVVIFKRWKQALHFSWGHSGVKSWIWSCWHFRDIGFLLHKMNIARDRFSALMDQTPTEH